MKTSETITELSKALIAAQAEMTNPALSKTNPHFKSKYADLPEVINIIRPVLAKHGLALLQSPDKIDDGWVLSTRIMHVSGEWIETVMPLIFTADRGSIMQALGGACTYARRYSSTALMNISGDDDLDGNNANTQSQGRQQQQQRQQPPRESLPDEHIDILVTDLNTINSEEGLKNLREQASGIKAKCNSEQIKRLSVAVIEATARLKGEVL